MRPVCLILSLALAGTFGVEAKTPPSAPPQTARQALLEVLTSKSPGALEKHLPDATRKGLLRGGPSNSEFLQFFSMFSVGLAANGKHIQTFDSGSMLVAIEENGGRQKLEVFVERDDLLGDTNEIELSIRFYKDGALEPILVLPRFTISMKEEAEVWKLNEITLAVRVPLGDPEFVKGLQKSQNTTIESSVVGGLRTLNTAEVSYAASFPDRGYTCKVPELGRQPGSEHVWLIDDVLASGKQSGYTVTISGCDARPASKYWATAVPDDPDSGMRAFCSDESGVVRYATDGKAATCLSEGVVIK